MKKTKQITLFLILTYVSLRFLGNPFLQLFGYKIYRVPAVSMLPTIAHNDRVIVNLDFYKDKDPVAGDIIAFKYPGDTKLDYVKRVIAVPGQTVRIEGRIITIDGQTNSLSVVNNDYSKCLHPNNKQGIVTRDLVTYTEQIGNIKYPDLYDKSGQGFIDNRKIELTLGPDEFFVMGNNRDFSADSRSWGPVKRELILGKLVIFSLSGTLNSDGSFKENPDCNDKSLDMTSFIPGKH